MRELASVWPHPTRQANADIQIESTIEVVALSAVVIALELYVDCELVSAGGAHGALSFWVLSSVLCLDQART
jgi:hypothetical protein